ncbi:MAG: M48 family metalloprotease, partial [Candidatus Omnitrophota bacterium]
AISLLTSKKDLGEERVDEFLPAGEAAWASEMVKIYYLSIWSVLSKALQDDGVVMPQKKIEEIINTIMNYASLVNKSFSGADASTFMVARDTLLEDFKNPAQLIAVFAHELGHRIDDIISDYINENEQDFAREDYSELFADLCAYYFLEKMGWESEISPMLATWAKQYENYSNVFPEPESKTIGLAEEEHKSARAFLDQIAEFLLGKGFRERTITQADALKLQKTFFTFLNFGITGKTEHANQIEFIALSQALAKFLRPVNEETADEEVIEVGTKVVATLDASPRRLVIVPRANLLIKLQSEEMQSQI